MKSIARGPYHPPDRAEVAEQLTPPAAGSVPAFGRRLIFFLRPWSRESASASTPDATGAAGPRETPRETPPPLDTGITGGISLLVGGRADRRRHGA
jgi:hypothetical protein